MAEINHEREQMIADTFGHELGCFENLAEEVVSGFIRAGIPYETGDFTEVVAGKSIIDRMIELLVIAPTLCQCEDADAE